MRRIVIRSRRGIDNVLSGNYDWFESHVSGDLDDESTFNSERLA